MGRDKALLPHAGGVLAQSVARAVERAAGSVALVGDPARYGHLGFPVVADAFGYEGPLGGILTALNRSGAEWNLITACDMPRLTAGFLQSLLDEAERRGCQALIPDSGGGRAEPLCAVYRASVRPVLEEAFRRGARRAAGALDAIGAESFDCSELSCFQNVNTPEEWARHER